MPTYTLEMREECGGRETATIEADEDTGACETAEAELRDWVRDGSYGDDAAFVSAHYTLIDEDGDTVVDDRGITVEIEPDHDALIRAAGGDTDCDHDWTSEGEGGCRENPGVWAVGGTAMVICSHCRQCGLRRHERSTGLQRNPGEHNTTEYHQPDRWCEDCQCEECECDA